MGFELNQMINNKGKVSCNKDILLSIINLAAKEIAGVASLCENFGSTLKKKFFNKYFEEGVKVGYVNDGINVNIYLNVFYGYGVTDIAYRVQENVKNAITSMMDIKVNSINIHVMGVEFVKEED